MTPSPLLYACAGLLVALILTIGVEQYRINSLDADVAGLKADNARLQAQADELKAANQDWAAKSETQRLAVESLARVANDAQAAGQKRVAAVLARPVAIPAGHGPAILNAWYGQP